MIFKLDRLSIVATMTTFLLLAVVGCGSGGSSEYVRAKKQAGSETVEHVLTVGGMT